MRNFAIFLFILLILSEGCRISRTVADKQQSPGPAQASSDPAQFNYHDQTTWLLGYFDPARLRQAPHGEWFFKGFDEYMPASNALNSLMDISQEGMTIKIVMGTWCPDSRREVPRFMRILDLWKFPADKITFVGVDEDKIAPVGDYASLNIERVPTFIFYKNNSEAGRIIEVPKASLEQDMVNILSGIE